MTNLELADGVDRLRDALGRNAISQLKELGGDAAGLAFLREDERFIEISVISYAAAKFFEKPYIAQSADWKKLVEETTLRLALASDALEEGKEREFKEHLDACIAGLQGLAKTMGRFVVNIADKARIKAATQIYAHGASLGEAAALAKVDKKELSNYIGQTTLSEKYHTVDLKKRFAGADALFS